VQVPGISLLPEATMVLAPRGGFAPAPGAKTIWWSDQKYDRIKWQKRAEKFPEKTIVMTTSCCTFAQYFDHAEPEYF
jgi:hypothetical protein